MTLFGNHDSKHLMVDIQIDGSSLTLEQAMSIASGQSTVSLSIESRDRMGESNAAVEDIVRSGDTVYLSLIHI